MKRLYLTVEGQTEQAFAVDVLQPHLAQFNVMVVKPRLTGLHARRRGRIPTGGLLSTFRHSLEDVRRWLKEDKSPDVRFSMMVDLYSLPDDFPGYEDAKGHLDPLERASALEVALADELNDGRFVLYLQVHEFEAMVLADPQKFVELFDGAEKSVDQLIAECQPFDSPELINDNQQSHPKARIKKYLEDYDENVDGPLLVASIGLETIRAKCPHFNDWLNHLEQLDA